MTEKTFHLRANEVRAESQALMQKLRAERLAVSRSRSKSTVAKTTSNNSSRKMLAETAKPAPAISTILASRKVQAALKPSAPAPATPIVAAPATPKPASPAKARKAHLVKTEAAAAKPAKAASRAAPSSTPAAKADPAPTAKPSKVAGSSKASDPGKAAKRVRTIRAIITDAIEPVAALHEAIAAVVAVAPDTQPEKTVKDRNSEPLTTIPALGPGMIWRLSQVGVKTLGDLASIDADDLRTRLGAVARLVRVENWIVEARRRSGSH